MAPIGLKAVVGESKIMLIINSKNFVVLLKCLSKCVIQCVLFYCRPIACFLTVRLRWFPLDAAGCYPAIVLYGEYMALGDAPLRMRIVHKWNTTEMRFIANAFLDLNQ